MGGLVSFLASQFVHWLTVVRGEVETTEGIYVCDSVSLDAASLGRRRCYYVTGCQMKRLVLNVFLTVVRRPLLGDSRLYDAACIMQPKLK